MRDGGEDSVVGIRESLWARLEAGKVFGVTVGSVGTSRKFDVFKGERDRKVPST